MALKYKSKNKPYRTGYFSAGQGHELYYELAGNPNGIPVVHLHGGPGAGFPQKDREYYNPKKFNVLLFDQRGSSHSKPLCETKNNTTQLLVKDIEKLMDFAGFEKAIIVGGSWGSTLALVFAIQHPDRVFALLVRGIYLANRVSRNHFYFGGVQSFFPEVHEKFYSVVPKKYQKQPEKYYYQKMRSKNKKTGQKYRQAWIEFEDSCLTIEPRKTDKKRLNENWAKSIATVGSYYQANNCFLPENYILKNAPKLKKIPTIIINGRYDMVCPPIQAIQLHEALPKSKLVLTIAGHAGHEKETHEAVIEALDETAKKVQIQTIEGVNKDWEETYQKKGIVHAEIEPFVKKTAAIFEEKKAQTVLDLGCGTGRNCFFLAKKGFTVYGIDSSPTAIKIAVRQLKGKQREKIRLKQGDMTKIPFKKNSFDAVICYRVIYHGTIKQIRKAIKEVHHVLKPNGIFALNFITGSFPEFRWGVEIEKNTFIHLNPKEYEVPHHFFTKKEILKETKAFKLLKIKPVYYPDLKAKKPSEYHLFLEKAKK